MKLLDVTGSDNRREWISRSFDMGDSGCFEEWGGNPGEIWFVWCWGGVGCGCLDSFTLAYDELNFGQRGRALCG